MSLCSFANMPKRTHAGTLKKKGPIFSKRASSEKNSEHKIWGVSYAAGQQNESHALRQLQQVSYPELCSWGPRVCRRYLFDHGVLSHSLPLCWGCAEPLTRTSRNMEDAVQCHQSHCRDRARVSAPIEAFTPLHSQARQHQEVDYVNFLRCAYLIGVKVPPDTMSHLLEHVDRKRVTKWCQDIRLALASAEFIDSTKIDFGPGVLEFDTASANVQRKAPQKDVAAAKSDRKNVEQKGNRFLARQRASLRKKPASTKTARKIFRGRYIVFILRNVAGECTSKKYAVLPLPAKVADEGATENHVYPKVIFSRFFNRFRM